MNNNCFIWTEGINCEEILFHSLKSFDTNHINYEINVYVSSDFTNNDGKFNFLNNKFIFHKVTKSLEKKFENGHLGTAILWTDIIKNTNKSKLIHFDSDVIFRENILDEIKYRLQHFDIVGPIRSYKNNPQNNDYFRQFNDTCSTCLFGFNKNKISQKYLLKDKLFTGSNFFRKIQIIFKDLFKYQNQDNDILTRMFLSYNPLGHKVLDSFDSITFDMINNGARIFFLDFNDVGGSNFYGSRDNSFHYLNNMKDKFKIEYGKKFIHFSSVGSGLFYSKNIDNINVSDSYVEYALDRYNLYNFLVNCDDTVILNSKYKYFKKYKNLREKFKY